MSSKESTQSLDVDETESDASEETSSNDENDDVYVAESTREKPKRRPRAYAVPAGASISPFGPVPKDCTSWGIKRMGVGGQWEKLSYGTDGLRAHEWPNAELTVENVRERWGSGTFRLQWWQPRANGGKRFACSSAPFTLDPLTPPAESSTRIAAAPSVAPAQNDPFVAFESAMRMMSTIDEKADQKLANLMQLRQFFAGEERGRGLDRDALSEILAANREATASAIRDAVGVAVAPINERLARLEGADDDDDDDDDDDGSAIGEVAATASQFVSGKGTLAKVLNFASANPKLAEMVLGIAQDAIGKIGTALVAQAPAPPPPPAPPQLHGQVSPAHSPSDTRTMPRARAETAPSPPPSPPPPPPQVVDAPAPNASASS